MGSLSRRPMGVLSHGICYQDWLSWSLSTPLIAPYPVAAFGMRRLRLPISATTHVSL